MKGTVKIKFTVGFGNNLFQYTYGRLVAEANDMKLNHRAIPEMNIEAQRHLRNPFLPTEIVGRRLGQKESIEIDYSKWLKKAAKPRNYIIRGYFEDYRLYKPHLENIRSWFPRVEKTNTKDVVIHIRLQNRILRLARFPHPDEFAKAVKQFGDYDRVHIVTDSAKWGDHTFEDIEEIARLVERKNGVKNTIRRLKGTNKIPRSLIKNSLENMKRFVDGMQQLNPVLHLSNAPLTPGSPAMRDDFIDDFNFIRSFDKILVHNSTFSWWAALLSDASKVGVWQPWVRGNKNLGLTDYAGWFQWGKGGKTLSQ